MSRPELPPEKRKVKRSVTLPKDIVDAGKATGNLSGWLAEAAREKLRTDAPARKRNKST